MPHFDHSFALVIGIDAYQHGMTPLNNAVNDARAIAELLESKHGYQVWRLFDEEATGEAIQNHLKNLLPQQVQKNDRLLFYFSGHGIQLNSQEGPEGYLIPQTAVLGQSETYLSMHEVYKDLTFLPCRHLLGILDCCFAGSFRWSSQHRKAIAVDSNTLYRERYDRYIHAPAWQVITSSAYDQLAYDAFDLKNDRGQDKERPQHSPFAATLLAGLDGGADLSPPAKSPGQKAGDGVITATELYQYLRDTIEPETDSRGMRQTPGLYPLGKHDKGEYIFLTPDHFLNLPPAPPLDLSTNPYRGLVSFDESDRDRYFGRTAITQDLYQFFLKHQLTVVLGTSGSGKSSLVKAGLLPRLRETRNLPTNTLSIIWLLIREMNYLAGYLFIDKSPKKFTVLPIFRPGISPFQSLNQVLEPFGLPSISPTQTSLKPYGSRTQIPQTILKGWFDEHPELLVVVIDQFEELITRCEDEERQLFLEMLATALQSYPQRIRLVITLRSDIESQFHKSPLQAFWHDSKFQVSPLTRQELKQVIEEPAARRVLFFDPPELVDQLISEIINMPGGLPLLSFALSELYISYLHRQEAANKQGTIIERAITLEDYEALGGVTRALIQRAEEEYERLVQEDAAYEETVQQVMLRMVTLGAGELARRPFLESEQQFPQLEQGRVQTVISHFLKARLLVGGQDTDGEPFVEPAHDALVQGWKRLLDWKRKHLGLLILQRELASDVYQWQASDKKKKDYGLLWSEDPRLPAALQLSCGRPYNDQWHILFKWRFNYHRWQSQPHAYWLNNPEADFVWQSFDQKFKRFVKSSSSIAVIFLLLSGLTT